MGCRTTWLMSFFAKTFSSTVQAAFTIKEVRELLGLPGVAFGGVPSHLLPPDPNKLPRSSKRIVELLLKGSRQGPETSGTGKRFSLDFLLSPQEFVGDEKGRLQSVRFNETQPDPVDPFSPNAGVRSLPIERDIKTNLCFRSIGQKSVTCANVGNNDYISTTDTVPSDGAILPFDEQKGVVYHDYEGRVIDPTSTATTKSLPGLYCTGWVKKGPKGVIATTMMDAFGTAETLIRDWETRLSHMGGSKSGWEGVQNQLRGSGSSFRPTTWADWERIDGIERRKGEENGKSREKMTRTEEMLRVL